MPFGVVVREDNRVEYEESFTASLSLPPSDGSNVRLGAISKTTVFIRDNDSKKQNYMHNYVGAACKAQIFRVQNILCDNFSR